MRSNSPCDILCGSQMTPPFAPPNGMFTTAHFHVIQLASARTSSRVTFGAKRIPPLPGPRTMEWCTRYPIKTSRWPLSSITGMYTVISLFGYFRNRYRPSSRFSFRAAASNRASADSYTLNSFLETSVAMANPPRTPGRRFMHPAGRTHAFKPASRRQHSAKEPEMASIRTNTTRRKDRNRARMVVRKQGRAGSVAPWFALHEFFDEELRKARGVMPDDDVF